MRIGIRWTIGDVKARGFDALRLSVMGAWSVFGRDATYVVFVNSVSIERVTRALAPLPRELRAALQLRNAALAPWLRARLGRGLAGGMGHKLAPMRAFPEHFELALDNDVVLWRMPATLAAWLREEPPSRGLVAGDVAGCFGRFEKLAGSARVNLGIRGVPPELDLEAALRAVLDESDLDILDPDDEQGAQLAALRRSGEPAVIGTDEVSICSPFWPHDPHPGHAGAHFVGLNGHLPWRYYDRPADDVRAEHWDDLAPWLEWRVRHARA